MAKSEQRKRATIGEADRAGDASGEDRERGEATGITHRPADREREEQSELPPRGERKPGAHA
jgi:hypothetical protein